MEKITIDELVAICSNFKINTRKLNIEEIEEVSNKMKFIIKKLQKTNRSLYFTKMKRLEKEKKENLVW